MLKRLQTLKILQKNIQQRHQDLTENDVQKWHQLMKEETATTRTISKFASGIITGLFGGDFRTSYNAADNAIENNFAVAIPLLLLEAGVISVKAYRAYRVARGAYSLYNLAEKVQNKAKEQAKDQKQGGGSGGGGDQKDPDEDPDKKDDQYKKADFEKGDKINLSRFSKRVSQSSGPKLEDPKSGEYLVKDRSAGTNRAHGGSYWKLFNKNGNRVATFSEDGIFLRK